MRALKGALLPLVLILAGTCGLPATYYLDPPVAPGVATPLGGESFRVMTTDRSADIAATFLGYEYYYKCYGDEADVTADQGYGSEVYDYSTLLSRGFHRICRGPSNILSGVDPDTSPAASSPPVLNMRQIDLLDLPVNDSIAAGITIQVWINDPNQPSGLSVPQASGLPASYLIYSPPSGFPIDPVALEVRRYVAGASLKCKTFDSNYTVSGNWDSATDVDISAAIWSDVVANGGLLYILVYAVCYGRGDDNITVVRSYPVYLGYTRTQVVY
jgi:hypothetical protein